MIKFNPTVEALNTPALAPIEKVGKGSSPLGQYGPAYENVASGALVIVKFTVSLLGQVPFVINVTAYVFKALAERFISPVVALINTNPAGEEDLHSQLLLFQSSLLLL